MGEHRDHLDSLGEPEDWNTTPTPLPPWEDISRHFDSNATDVPKSDTVVNSPGKFSEQANREPVADNSDDVDSNRPTRKRWPSHWE